MGEAGGLGAEGFAVVFFDFVEVAHTRAGEADELPANHPGIAAVHGVAEHSFDGVLAEESEENGGFDLLQSFVLAGGWQEMKIIQALQSFAIDLARGFFALITEFTRGIFEGRLRVAVAIAAVGTGELAVDVDGDACFARAGAGFVGGEDARSSSGDNQSLGLGEKAKRNADWFLLGGEERGFAIERIDEDATEGCC